MVLFFILLPISTFRLAYKFDFSVLAMDRILNIFEFA